MTRTFIIAEAGVNHNGSVDLALKLVDAAKEAGADAVKFQTFKTEKVISKKAPLAEYQKNNCENEENQFEMVKKLELSYMQFRKIKQHCDLIGIKFMSTPDEEESLNFLVDDLKVDIIKIGSGEVTNIPYLRRIAQKGKSVILSTGMSNLLEVKLAIKELEENGCKDIILLHCNTDYPTKIKDVNLKAMQTLAKIFDKNVGYSDHTLGMTVSLGAVALGACVIEKHFTLDKKLEGPDHKASMNPIELKNLVKAIRELECALGIGEKRASLSEQKNKEIVRRSIVAAKEIKEGEIFTSENLCCKRPGTGISPIFWDEIIGKVAPKAFKEDEMILL